jgi:ribosome-associated heat shock protein Hsp15
MQAVPSSIRLDKWLWHARLCKTRSIAARLVAEGKVRVNATRVSKPATQVRIGDGISFARDGRIHVLRILSLGERRGPAPEARLLYADLEAAASSENAPQAPAGFA